MLRKNEQSLSAVDGIRRALRAFLFHECFDSLIHGGANAPNALDNEREGGPFSWVLH